jgi:hypothetical protein
MMCPTWKWVDELEAEVHGRGDGRGESVEEIHIVCRPDLT